MSRKSILFSCIILLSFSVVVFLSRQPRTVAPNQIARQIGELKSRKPLSSKSKSTDKVKDRTRRQASEEPDDDQPGFDQPGQALEYYNLKRAPAGEKVIPVERYFTALGQMRSMPQFSSARNAATPSRSAMATDNVEPESLGTWNPLGPGNIGGRTRAILIHPTTPSLMYAAGVAGGVWRSTNSGQSWTPLNDLFPSLAVSSLVMDPTNPNVIYAGTGEGFFNADAVRGAGILKTTDGGNTWVQLPSTANSNFFAVNDLVISPNSNQRIYAATGSGVWRSSDGGQTWTRVHNPTGLSGGCLDLAIRTDQSTDVVFTACGNFFSSGAVFRNIDAGGVGIWETVLHDPGMARASLAIAPSNQNIVYAMLTDQASENLLGVFRSDSGGADGTWTATVRFFPNNGCNIPNRPDLSSQGWYDNVIAVDPTDPQRVWAGGPRLYRSDDGGVNWGSASVNIHPDNHTIVFHPQYNGTSNQTVFVGNDGGIFRSDNARAQATPNGSCASNIAISWINSNLDYGVTQFYHGIPFPDGLTYFGGTQDNGTVLGADTAGANGWRAIFGGDGGWVAVDPTNTNNLYVEFQGFNFLKSTNGGQNFNFAKNGISSDDSFMFITPFFMDPINPQRLWVGGRTLWRTTDGALNWTAASPQLTTTGNFSALAISPTHPDNTLAATSDGFIFRTNVGLSANASTTWTSVQPRPGYVSWLAFDPTNSDVAYATYSSFNRTFLDHHVFKTLDAGATWFAVDNGIPDLPVHSIAIDPTNVHHLYVGTDLGVFTSLDGGNNWLVENTGFANVVTEAVAITTVQGTPMLFAFTHGRGAWRVPLSSGQVCNYSISPTSQDFSPTGGTGNVTVTANPGCSWIVSNNSSAFVNVTSGNSGTGNGSVGFSVAANSPNSIRTGSLTIAGKTFKITEQSTDPIGVITSITPNTTLVGGSGFTLTVNGSSFIPASVVQWNGSPRPTQFGDNSQITATISAADIAAAGTVNVSVMNPAGLSNVVPFTVTPTGTGFTFNDFSSVSNLTIRGNAVQSGNRLRLTSTFSQASAAWFNLKQPIQNGFDTTFQFIIDPQGGTPADGLTFTIQNNSINALGGGGGGLGYDGIPNSLAVEFDIFDGGVDGSSNQISVHTLGTAPNSSSETASIGATSNIPILANAQTHTARILYTPGTMQIFLDNPNTPVLTVTVNLATKLSLESGAAFPGFTGGTGGFFAVQDILNWSFTVVGAPDNPVPAVTTLSPGSGVAGGQPFTLTVNGSNFVNGSKVRWNGNDRTTSFVNGGQLTAAITAADIAAVGNNLVTVFNSAPGGGTSNSLTFTVNKQSQTITFNQPANHTFGDLPFALSASANSLLPVSFSIIAGGTGSGTLNGSTLTITGAGTIIIQADQAGNATFNAASPVQRTLLVNKANQTITFPAIPTQTFGDGPFSLGATSSSNLAVTYAVTVGQALVSLNGNQVTILGAGNVTIQASQAGDSNYNAATNAQQSFTINKANQTITFGPLVNKIASDAPFTLNATATSNLSVTFSVTAGGGSVNLNGNTVTILTIGSVTIKADQAGNANFNAAAGVQQSFTTGKGTALLTLNTPTQIADGNPKLATVTTSPPGLGVISITYNGSATPPSVPGTYNVSATLSNPNFNANAPTGKLRIVSFGPTNNQSVAPGTSNTATVLPAGSNPGISTTLNHTSPGTTANLTVGVYSGNPSDRGLVNADGGFADTKVTNPNPGDTAVLNYYYPSTITGTNETQLQLFYFTGFAWALVRDGNGNLPTKITTDNQDGTTSGGKFTVTLGSTSQPKVSQLTGTFFAASTAIMGDCDLSGVVNVTDLITMANFLAGNTTPTPVQKSACDVLADGVLNVSDLLTLANFLAGNTVTLPVIPGGGIANPGDGVPQAFAQQPFDLLNYVNEVTESRRAMSDFLWLGGKGGGNSRGQPIPPIGLFLQPFAPRSREFVEFRSAVVF